jgi:HK97 family phage prohead protease
MSSLPNAWLASRARQRRELTERIAASGRVSLEGIKAREANDRTENEIDLMVHLADLRRKDQRLAPVSRSGSRRFKRLAAGCLKTKAIDCQFKANGSDTFQMYGCIWSNVDRQNDVIEPGAVDNVDEFLSEGWIALSHDQAKLAIGYPIDAIQDSTGFLVTAKWHSTPAAWDARTVVRERLAAGKDVKASIGYVSRPDGESFERGRDGQVVRRLSKISVYECSIVNLAANPAAHVLES